MSDLMNTFRKLFPSQFRASGLMTALMFLICVSAAQSASAATYTVTTTADSGAGSLRAAIASANASAVEDTINFAIPASNLNCPAGVCTITLTSGELVINDAATAGTLTIINLTGAGNLLVSGNNNSRVLNLNAGANLTIKGITITKGNILALSLPGVNGLGGGIYNQGGVATLNDSIVSGNQANYQGGGIYNTGTFTLNNSIVSGNRQD